MLGYTRLYKKKSLKNFYLKIDDDLGTMVGRVTWETDSISIMSVKVECYTEYHSLLLNQCLKDKGAGEMAQLVRCLLRTFEDPSSDRGHPHKKLAVLAHTYNLSSEEAETGGSLGLAGQPA